MVYNKSRPDFDNDEAYDDYLEKIEDMVYRLTCSEVSQKEKKDLWNQID